MIGRFRRSIGAAACLLAFANCVTTKTTIPPEEARHHEAAVHLRDARATRESVEQSASHYLAAAAEAGPLLGAEEAVKVREIYNAAAQELTVLLRSADQGRLWNRPLTVAAGGTTYPLPDGAVGPWCSHFTLARGWRCCSALPACL